MARPSHILHPPRSRETGSVLIYVVLGIATLIGFASLSVDVGLAYNARTQAQAAADAAALAAASNMIDKTGPAVTLDPSRTAAIDVASQNEAFPNPALVLRQEDITYGFWDVDARTFDLAVDLTDPDRVTGVRTLISMDGAVNDPVPSILARVLGFNEFAVETTATAYLGYAGAVGPGDVELPFAIPCCVLTGSGCNGDYCAGGAPIPNPCTLDQAQARGENTVSCLQFHNTAEQTACWTEFDGSASNVNTSDLVDIAIDGLPEGVDVYDSIYLDNGDKTPVVQIISDRFYGEGDFLGSPEGSDTDGDGIIDSWVTGLPVVECQSTDHCAKGDPADLVGFVCMEIREVTVTPDKIIRAQFLCPELHPGQFQQCLTDLGVVGTGGQNFGIRADLPVLVQ
jgi:Flp pilus assembly protein TadG